MDPVLDIDNLQVRRGRTVIIERLTWSVQRDQHWCILGANGSGKTTLLSVLLGYFIPSGGTIRVCGYEYGKGYWPDLRRKIGIVSQRVSAMINQPVSALEVIMSGKDAMLNQYLRPDDITKGKARDILHKMNAAYLADRSWLKLSQGERQRVLIGRALMADAQLLILDEPCAGLDPVAREHFLQFIDTFALRKTSPTILFVTHHIEEITPAFANIMLLKAGRMLASGSQKDVLTAENLSDAYGWQITLTRQKQRYNMQVNTVTRKIM